MVTSRNYNEAYNKLIRRKNTANTWKKVWIPAPEVSSFLSEMKKIILLPSPVRTFSADMVQSLMVLIRTE